MSLEQRKFDAQRFFQSDFLFFSIAIFRGWSDFRMTTKYASTTTTLHSGDHQPYTSKALNFSCLKSMTFWWSEDMLWEASIFDTFCISQLNLTRIVWSSTRTVFFGSHFFSFFTPHLHGDFDFETTKCRASTTTFCFFGQQSFRSTFFQSSVRLNVVLRRQRVPRRNVYTETDYSNSWTILTSFEHPSFLGSEQKTEW